MGKFCVSAEHLEQPNFVEFLKALRFVPYRVEPLPMANQFRYIGTSPLFEMLGPGDEVPSYELHAEASAIDENVLEVVAIKL